MPQENLLRLIKKAEAARAMPTIVTAEAALRRLVIAEGGRLRYSSTAVHLRLGGISTTSIDCPLSALRNWIGRARKKAMEQANG